MDERLTQRAMAPRYTFVEAAELVGRPSDTVRRWSSGNPRTYKGTQVVDKALITMDGKAGHGSVPLSFLNLLELQMLSRYRDDAALQAIRPALAYTASMLGQKRPLLTVEFKIRGGELFTRFVEQSDGPDLYVNATRGGQITLADIVLEATSNIDYSETGTAQRWWLRSRNVPLIVDTKLAAGNPITARTVVRLDAITSRHRDGYLPDQIAYDTGALEDEVVAALELVHAA